MRTIKNPEKILLWVLKDLRLISLSCLCLVGFFTFSKFVSEVLEGESRTLDTAILMLLRDPQNSDNLWGPGWFQEMMRDITGLGGIAILTLITITSAVYFLVIRKRGLALYVLCSVGTGMLFSNFLKMHFDRPRPDLVPHDSIIYTASFGDTLDRKDNGAHLSRFCNSQKSSIPQFRSRHDIFGSYF